MFATSPRINLVSAINSFLLFFMAYFAFLLLKHFAGLPKIDSLFLSLYGCVSAGLVASLPSLIAWRHSTQTTIDEKYTVFDHAINLLGKSGGAHVWLFACFVVGEPITALFFLPAIDWQFYFDQRCGLPACGAGLSPLAEMHAWLTSGSGVIQSYTIGYCLCLPGLLLAFLANMAKARKALAANQTADGDHAEQQG